MSETIKRQQLKALVKCQHCIQETTPLFPYVGKIKVATITEDGKGILYTIRCDYPDDLTSPALIKRTHKELSQIIEDNDFHMIVMQRRPEKEQ